MLSSDFKYAEVNKTFKKNLEIDVTLRHDVNEADLVYLYSYIFYNRLSNSLGFVCNLLVLLFVFHFIFPVKKEKKKSSIFFY